MIKRRPVPGVVSDPRSWGLIAVALIYLSRGLAYTFTTVLEPLPYGLDVLAGYISIKVYGVLWVIGAGVGFWMALWRRRKVWGAAVLTVMPTFWGIAFLFSWLLDDYAWTGIFVYGCLSVIAVAFAVQQPQRVVFNRADDSS